MIDCYHVTVLSNFIRGYDKYSRQYSKANIPESSYPEQFFLLARDELSVGIERARALLAKTGLPADRLLVLHTRVPAQELQPNLRTGKGRFVARAGIELDSVHLLDDAQQLQPISVEEAGARSLACFAPRRRRYDELRPRTVSLLPIARGCQARCAFCFSAASVSSETRGRALDWSRIEAALARGRQRGAERAVITGGGEPGLLSDEQLVRLVAAARRHFDKVVLISNGHSWANRSEDERLAALERLADAGLAVLSLSRHHHDRRRNAQIMGLDIATEEVARTWTRQRARLGRLALRWICVLQKGGIEDRRSLADYLAWAAASGVGEVCFKELYVSTTSESEYHAAAANTWSREHQVPLRLVLDAARDGGWERVAQLPWGAPIFAAALDGAALSVAAYTEPSVYWELHHGLCRSWNLMADGRCLASLEDRHSEVQLT
jgi:molybdenum cofactor biosynthesis enzyme MoaA